MPSITIWDRIEPRCRANDPTPGLEARVHDPLWLLARQWQVGEFEGRDAGSPVVATVGSSTAALDRFSVAGQAVQPYGGLQPIETLVEQEQARTSSGATDLRQAAESGLYFLRLLASAQLPPAIAGLYRAQYALSIAPFAGRVVDGVKLHADLIAAGASLPALPAIPAPQQAAVLKATRDWLAWYGSLFAEPGAQSGGWSPDRMEYGFAMASAGDSGSYVAREYDGGSVDWHTFDRSPAPLAGGTAPPAPATQNVLVTPVTFRGMAARRFWELEDSGTNIALLAAAAEDLGRLLLREFVLIYGSDWFQFPMLAPVGSQFLVSSLSVADTFGVTTPIPHYTAADGPLGKWRMFAASTDPLAPPVLTTAAGPAHPLLIPPSAVGSLDSAAIEDVLLLRDELANLAWGIERTALDSSGRPVDRTLAWRTNSPTTPPPTGDPVPHYRLGSTVPDYWLPLLPVRLDAAGHLQLRRGRLPNDATGPLGKLLAGDALTVYLEEIPREGVHLERRYRLARGSEGSAYLWIGRRRSTGRGEGRSGLRFDFVE